MKTILTAGKTQVIVLSSLIASLGFLATPKPSIADREILYKNCAGLQKVMNDYNPGHKYKGFEKVKMTRRNYYDGSEQYMVFCNGGIVIDREAGTICRGYIAYSFARIAAIARYYSDWGETNGLPNNSDTGKGNYCRLIK
jgi:hypothetical protein